MVKFDVTSLTLLLNLNLVSAKVNPVIDPDFQVSLVEVDSDNVTILEETLAFDINLRRSHMYAEGSLVHGLVYKFIFAPCVCWLNFIIRCSHI